MSSAPSKRVALVTGVGRRAGIGAAIADVLAADGWTVATTFWTPYDERMPWGADPPMAAPKAPMAAMAAMAMSGVTMAVAADLESPDAPAALFDEVTGRLGPVSALVMCHCESVDSSILDTTVESFDRHYRVNARATWLLIREFAQRYSGPFGDGRIVALTSDHTAFNLPYGATKGALDRIVIAAATELTDLGVTANVVNPGPNDTGWMASELQEQIVAATPLRRLGRPADTAALVRFLCSSDGGWINGQLISSNGGFAPHR